jgi:peptidoglycan-associated lipoprotein
MRKIVPALFIAIALAGCSSTPTKEQAGAAVEDRSSKPMDQPKPPEVVDVKPVVPGSADSGSALAGDPALRDPNSILSKRLVYFDYDSNIVKEQFRPLVSAHAKYIVQHNAARMVIQGHTDERGSREYNLALGQRRADAVKQMMTVLGADAARIETVSFGEEKPAAEGATEAAFAQNRRAVIVYQGE